MPRRVWNRRGAEVGTGAPSAGGCEVITAEPWVAERRINRIEIGGFFPRGLVKDGKNRDAPDGLNREERNSGRLGQGALVRSGEQRDSTKSRKKELRYFHDICRGLSDLNPGRQALGDHHMSGFVVKYFFVTFLPGVCRDNL